MSTALLHLNAAIDEVLSEPDSALEPKELRAAIDRLEKKFCALVHTAQQRGEHLSLGFGTTAGWVAKTCGMSANSVADRLCVGEQLESMPRVAQALDSGEISYQSTAVLCQLRRQLGEKAELLDEEHWIGQAKELSVRDLIWVADHVRYFLDPDGFDRGIEEDYEQRWLKVAEMKGMYHLKGVLDREGGAALKTAIDALAKRLGGEDRRSSGQRRADALTELVYRALDKGALPRRNGVRPHVTVTTTVEALKGEAGAPASELQGGLPVSSKTAQRLACDGTMTRVVKADSMVIDVGRATRAISGSQRRGVNARFRGCGFPGCDRPVSMTSVHHIEFWGAGGASDMSNFLTPVLLPPPARP